MNSVLLFAFAVSWVWTSKKILLLFCFFISGGLFKRKRALIKTLGFLFWLIDINLNSVVQIIKRCRHRAYGNRNKPNWKFAFHYCAEIELNWIILRIRGIPFLFGVFISIDATMCVGINNNFVYIMTSYNIYSSKPRLMLYCPLFIFINLHFVPSTIPSIFSVLLSFSFSFIKTSLSCLLLPIHIIYPCLNKIN